MRVPRFLRGPVVVAALALLPACEQPTDRLGRGVASVFCERLYRCCSPEEREQQLDTWGVDFSSLAGCVDWNDGPEMEEYRIIGAADGVTFHADAVEPCLKRLREMTCAYPGSVGNTRLLCPELFTSTRPDGESCDLAEQCASGWCEREECATRHALGESCQEYPYQCVDGAFCAFEAQQGICRPQQPAGGPCASSAECLFPLECSGGACGESAFCDGI